MRGVDLARRRLALFVFWTASVARADGTPASEVRAGGPSGDVTGAAQALFDEGRRLVAEKRYAEGCAKLEQSFRLDAAAGTEVNLADCYEQRGEFASAWVAFLDASALAQRGGREKWATQSRDRARLLERRVPTLALLVDGQPPGLEIRRDGVLVAPSTFGAPVPLNPGSYLLEARAPGRLSWSLRISLAESARVILRVPVLAENGLLASQGPGQDAGVVDRSAGSHTPGSRQRVIALGLAAVATVPLGIGAVFGVTAMNRNAYAAALCPSSPRCTDPRAIASTDDARHAAGASNVLFIAGGALFAAGTVLFLTAPREAGKFSLAFADRGAALSLDGTF